MLSTKLFAVSALVLFSVAATACSEDDDVASTSMKLTTRCMRNACDARRERDRLACDRCMDAAFDAMYYVSGIDPGRSCTLSCEPSDPCSDDERARCEDEKLTFEVLAPAHAELQASCERFFTHVTGCGTTTAVDRAVCATWAKIERPEMKSVYDCVTNAPCDAIDSCAMPPASSLGDEMCNRIETVCGMKVCDAQQRDVLNGDGAWLKDDVVAAARECLVQPTCTTMRSCINAWIEATKR